MDTGLSVPLYFWLIITINNIHNTAARRKGIITMRIFKKYSPAMIAKHVRTFFKGRLYIHGRGAYEFDKGAVLMPVGADDKHRDTVRELNSYIGTSKT